MKKGNQRLNWMRPVLRKMNHRMLSNYNSNPQMAKTILLLTTRGRKSGQPRTTPLQYELIDGKYVLAAGWGEKSDWLLNLRADPQVEIQIGQEHYSGTAEIVEDPISIAKMLEVKIKSKPFITWVMRFEGLPLFYSRGDLEKFASGKVMVVIRMG